MNEEDRKFLERLVRKGILVYIGFWGAMIILLHIGFIVRKVFFDD